MVPVKFVTGLSLLSTAVTVMASARQKMPAPLCEITKWSTR